MVPITVLSFFGGFIPYIGGFITTGLAFLVAVANNYTWNRIWTFRGQRGHFAYQGMRFLIVSVVALGANLLLLHVLVVLGVSEIPAQAIAIILVTPLNFLGNKLWSFRLAHAGSS